MTVTETRTITYVQAFNEAVRQAMEADPDVFCAGEDIGAYGGVFGTFSGLQEQFGERRCVDTPISEQAIVGLGIGAAVNGLRPIVDLMFMDFICVALDQIVNQAAKLKYMFGGEAILPLTITTAGGAGQALAQFRQSLQGGTEKHRGIAGGHCAKNALIVGFALRHQRGPLETLHHGKFGNRALPLFGYPHHTLP